jgi:hypothetical protein
MRRAVASGVEIAVAMAVVLVLAVQPAGASHPRTKSTAPLRVSLVPAYTACVAPDRTHGPPLAFPSCSSPQQASSRLTAGNPPTQAAQLVGDWRVHPIAGVPGPPDDSQARILSSVEDVRCGAPSAGCPTPGADYAGDLEVRIQMRISDHYNAVVPGPSYPDPATMQDIELAFDFSCATTSDPGIGATCSYHTDLTAYYPGALKDSKRMIMEFGPVRVFDGGADGDAATDDGSAPFLTQGLFVP